MKMSARDRRAASLGCLALAAMFIYRLMTMSDSSTTAQAVPQTSAQLRLRLAMLRQTAATLPVREALLKQTDADLADREKGIVQGDTAAQAQAELVETARRVGKANDIDVRAGDSPAPKTLGDYGIVYSTISFDCHIEQLLNFLADLTRERELIVPSEEHINSGDPKQKLVTVRMVLAGVVAKKLIPEKKGLGAF